MFPQNGKGYTDPMAFYLFIFFLKIKKIKLYIQNIYQCVWRTPIILKKTISKTDVHMMHV